MISSSTPPKTAAAKSSSEPRSKPSGCPSVRGAQLFDVSIDNVGLHLNNNFAEGELLLPSVTEHSSVTAADGKNYLTKLYNLVANLALGYRVRSPRGLQFPLRLPYSEEPVG